MGSYNIQDMIDELPPVSSGPSVYRHDKVPGPLIRVHLMRLGNRSPLVDYYIAYRRSRDTVLGYLVTDRPLLTWLAFYPQGLLGHVHDPSPNFIIDRTWNWQHAFDVKNIKRAFMRSGICYPDEARNFFKESRNIFTVR